MNSKGMLSVALFLLGALVVAVQGQGQAPALARRTSGWRGSCGSADGARSTGAERREISGISNGEMQEPTGSSRSAWRRWWRRGAAATNPDGSPKHRDYKVTAIPGVIADGAMWKTVWTGRGNNADGPVATSDGGMLFAQNTDSKIMKLDKDGKVSFPYEKRERQARSRSTKRAPCLFWSGLCLRTSCRLHRNARFWQTSTWVNLSIAPADWLTI